MEKSIAKIPFTIITGFLGAGKTTLLNRLLVADHGHRLAVIINEFGAVNIDSQFIAENIGDGIVEMTNGCVCCTVREDLMQGLQGLLEQRQNGSLPFDHIVMETTGMAKVGPIVQTLGGREIKSNLALGGIATVVDGYHVAGQLDEFEEVAEQIGMADLILLNKTDLIDEADCDQLKNRLASMNKGAQILLCSESQIDVGELLTLQSNKNIERTLNSIGSEHHHDHEHHHHSDQVTSFVIRISGPLEHGLVQDWFSYLIMRYTEQLLRYKGHLNIRGRKERLVVQGVHSFFNSTPGRLWQEDETAQTELVFIGKNLPEKEIREGFQNCIASSHV